MLKDNSAMIKNEISKPVLVIFIIAVAVFFFLVSKADPDIWGHVKFGQDIYESHAIPRYDTYSYSAYGARWINHEWLSELIFYSILKHARGAGLNLFKFFVGLFITFLIYKTVKTKTSSILLRLLFILVPLSVITYGFAIRPQIFTYLFFTIAAFIIDRVENGANKKTLFILPAVFLLWCNLHGGFVAGIGMMLIYTIFKLFARQMSPGALCAVAICVPATFVNPYGTELWHFLSGAVVMPRPFITEWQAVDRVSFGLVGYAIISFAVGAGILFLREKRHLYEAALMAAAFYISIKHSRHMVLFAILASVYAPKYIDSILSARLYRLERGLSRNFFNMVCVLFSIFFMLGVFGNARTNPFRIEIREEEYPIEAVEFIRANGIKGNIFAWFDWAEMCIRELSQTNKVFVDGRYETVYSNALMNGYFGVIYDKINYRDYLSRFPQTDIMFLSLENPLLARIAYDKSWVLAYSSSRAAIFLKDNQNNKSVIGRIRDNSLNHPKMEGPFYFE